MTGHIQRIKDELRELQSMAHALNGFITQSVVFQGLHQDEQNRLNAQYFAMKRYESILEARLLAGTGKEEPECVSFAVALEAVIAGKRIARKGWNGKGQFVVKAGGYEVSEPRTGSDYAKAGVEGAFYIAPHLDLKNAQGHMQPGWVPSQGDLFAKDWVIL